MKIRPTTIDYWWARACWWWNSWVQDTVLKEIVYDGSYIWYAASATDTWNYFRAYQYIKWTFLKKAPEEYLPDTVTTIWNYFRYAQYQQCTALLSSPKECLPSSITTIWTEFRWYQYYYCSNLRIAEWLNDLTIWNSSDYRYYQYGNSNINVVKVLWNVWYPNSYITDSIVMQVRVPAEYLPNFVNATTNPRTQITDSKFVGYVGWLWE